MKSKSPPQDTWDFHKGKSFWNYQHKFQHVLPSLPISLPPPEFEAKNSPSPIFAPIANQISIGGPNTDFKSRAKFLPNVNLQSDVPWRLIEREGRTMQCNAGLYFLLSPPDINFASLSVKNCRASQASSALIQIWQMEQNTIESCEKICSFFLILEKWISCKLLKDFHSKIIGFLNCKL